MTSPTSCFRINITAWSASEIELSVADEEAALLLAEDLYETDTDRFAQIDGGISSSDVEAVG